MKVVAAVVQMTSTSDSDANLDSAERLVSAAAARGASFVSLPENFAFLRCEGDAGFESQDLDGSWVRRMGGVAARHRITLLLGSIPERIPGEERVFNTSVVLGPDGQVLGCYRKIHLFDVELPGLAPYYESGSVVAGERPVVVTTPAGALGLSICYDLRFPELYRHLVAEGAEVLTVPAAFTERTGKDHWEVLLRARAIENLTYVVAPAQVGRHAPGRASHGHAMIVDPWGGILAQVADAEGVAVAELDFERQAQLRRELPALSHRRLQ
jgi:predicted amidohydrolase